MKVVEIKQIAQQKGVSSVKMKKADLIRAIQSQEGNNTCFESATNPLTGVTPCDLSACCWRSDCVID
jgi:hypothetical protein